MRIRQRYPFPAWSKLKLPDRPAHELSVWSFKVVQLFLSRGWPLQNPYFFLAIPSVNAPEVLAGTEASRNVQMAQQWTPNTVRDRSWPFP
ncbi:MAG: hypothetical protein AAGE59_14150 [Cyanobacteria bacterium P01_F01_bin.86]